MNILLLLMLLILGSEIKASAAPDPDAALRDAAILADRKKHVDATITDESENAEKVIPRTGTMVSTTSTGETAKRRRFAGGVSTQFYSEGYVPSPSDKFMHLNAFQLDNVIKELKSRFKKISFEEVVREKTFDWTNKPGRVFDPRENYASNKLFFTHDKIKVTARLLYNTKTKKLMYGGIILNVTSDHRSRLWHWNIALLVDYHYSRATPRGFMVDPEGFDIEKRLPHDSSPLPITNPDFIDCYGWDVCQFILNPEYVAPQPKSKKDKVDDSLKRTPAAGAGSEEESAKSSDISRTCASVFQEIRAPVRPKKLHFEPTPVRRRSY